MIDIKEIVEDLAKTHTPSQIGHILRDEYQIRIPKLTRYFENLDEDKSYLKKLTLKIRYMQMHLKDNKKDYATQRQLVKLILIRDKLISKTNSS